MEYFFGKQMKNFDDIVKNGFYMQYEEELKQTSNPILSLTFWYFIISLDLKDHHKVIIVQFVNMFHWPL